MEPDTDTSSDSTLTAPGVPVLTDVPPAAASPAEKVMGTPAPSAWPADGDGSEAVAIPVRIVRTFAGPGAAAQGATSAVAAGSSPANASGAAALEAVAPAAGRGAIIDGSGGSTPSGPVAGALQHVGPLNVLDEIPLDEPEEDLPPPPVPRFSRRRLLGLGLLAVGCLAAILLGIRIDVNKTKAQEASESPSGEIAQQRVPLEQLAKQLGAVAPASGVVTVNGQLQVTNSLVLQPSALTGPAVAGQIYFDSTDSTLAYYNGTGFVQLRGGGSSTTNNTYNTYLVSGSGSSSLTGSGTPGALALFSSSDQLADSLITQSGSSIDIGTAGASGITVGNDGQVGPTDIVGGSGGVNLADASGNVTVSSAANATVTAATLTLRGGASGGVLVEPQADSTAAFEVENAADNTTLLNVDTTDSQISLGTGAGSDIGYSGIGPWVGGSTGDGTISSQRVTTTAAGTITSMSAYISAPEAPDNQFQFAIYADNGSQTAPGAYVASSPIGTLGAYNTRAWYTLPITAALSANTTYWLVYWQNLPPVGDTYTSFIYGPGSASQREAGALYTWQSGPAQDNGMPSTWPNDPTTTATTVASLYASFAGSGPALSINQYGTLSQQGAAIFQDPTDSSQALQVEDSLGNALLAVDTTDMQINIGGSLDVSGTVTAEGHIVTAGNAPTITADSAAACGGTATATLSGDDTAGTVSVTTGSGSCSGTGDLVTVTFSSTYGAAPRVTLTPDSASAQQLGAYNDRSVILSTAFTLATGSTPSPDTTYSWDYQVLQ